MEPTELSQDKLVDLYKVHIEEVRFQTKFNWDRTQYFLVLNLGIVGAAAGIWKAEIALTGLFLLGMLFLCGIFICIMSIAAMRQGHKYYRRAVLQKSKVEVLLGLHDVVSETFPLRGQDLSTISTPGKEEAIKNLDNPEAYLNRPSLRKGQINWYLQWFLYLICLVDAAGLLWSSIRSFRRRSIVEQRDCSLVNQLLDPGRETAVQTPPRARQGLEPCLQVPDLLRPAPLAVRLRTRNYGAF